MSIKLYNRGKRTIEVLLRDDAGQLIVGDKGLPRTHLFKPESAIEFNDATGAHLKRLYKHELMSMDDVQRQFDSFGQPTQPAAAQPHANAVPVAPVMQSDLTEEELEAVRLIRMTRAAAVDGEKIDEDTGAAKVAETHGVESEKKSEDDKGAVAARQAEKDERERGNQKGKR